MINPVKSITSGSVHDGNLRGFDSWMIKYGYTFVDVSLLFLLVTCVIPGRGTAILRWLFSARWIVCIRPYR